MQRLYLQFYVTILVVLAVFVGAAALLWRLADDDNRTPQYLDVAAELTGALLPDADAAKPDQQKAIEVLHRKLRFDIALYRADGDMIAMAGKPPPRFEARKARIGWRRGPGGPNFTLQLPDGRWLVARQVRERPNPTFWIAAFLALVGIAVAVGAFPVVRGLGRRLERLRAGVERLGGGDLAARVKVEGRDEVAALAASFNRSAQRIEELGGRVSVLNPFFYAGSFAIGAISGLLGDKWNMGFLAETERQVEGHLDGHLEQLPVQDEKSRAIVAQMKEDEARHASTALAHGAAELPEPVKQAMRISSRLMTVSTYRL